MADDNDLLDLLGPEPEVAPAPPAPEVKALTPGRAMQRRSRSYLVKGKLNSPARLKNLLTAIGEMPVATDACMRAGISYSTLKYWLTKSNEGAPGDGFDVAVMPGEDPIRFHDAWESAMLYGVERVEKAAIDKALGVLEPLTFQGRVIYKLDPDLLSLGFAGHEAYLKDANGQPVPETVLKQDPDLMQFILKARKPDVYGTKQQIDVNHRGGVLVVSAVATSSAALAENSADFRADAVDAEFEDLSNEEGL